MPGVSNNDSTVHLYSEGGSVGSSGVGAGRGLVTHVGNSQSNLRNDDVISRKECDWKNVGT